MTPGSARASEGESRRSLQTIGLVTCSCLSVLAAFAFAARIPRGDATLSLCAQEKVNPNTAPVGSLIRLPGIGLTRARAIVARRDAVQRSAGKDLAFRRSADLQQIKGIGPQTAGNLAGWLEFDSDGPHLMPSSSSEPDESQAVQHVSNLLDLPSTDALKPLRN
jgi:hypothetical protein